MNEETIYIAIGCVVAVLAWSWAFVSSGCKLKHIPPVTFIALIAGVAWPIAMIFVVILALAWAVENCR